MRLTSSPCVTTGGSKAAAMAAMVPGGTGSGDRVPKTEEGEADALVGFVEHGQDRMGRNAAW